jgi:hypothetical protein
MADILISYARQDRDRIGKLAAALEAAGFSVWRDRHIAGGAEFSKDIERELAAATVVIVAWSERAIESRWVKDEAIAYVRAHSIENKTYVNILLVAIGAYDVGPPYAAVLWGKDYARYRRSPQFKGYIRGAGVHDYWKAHRFAPQCKPVGEDDFECE